MSYDVKNIKTLEGIEAIRMRAGMYIGSTGYDGVKHITLEIISNAVDEYMNGYCDKIIININDTGDICIIDNGRGVPFGKAEDGTETLENVFTKLHTGAKFDEAGKAGYNSSGGLNGIGSKATNALSEYFAVTSIRDGKIAHMEFKEGKRISYEIKDYPKNYKYQQGTVITFKPDKKIFKEEFILKYEDLKTMVKELSYLCPGLTFELAYNEKEIETIQSSHGVIDYVNDLNKNKTTLTSVFYTETKEDRIGIQLAMQYNDTYSDVYRIYTNSIPNSGGTHLTGFRTALTQQINEYARKHKLLKDKDSNITGEELKEGLTLVLSFIMPDPVFSGQTKDVLTSSEGRTIVQRLVSEKLAVWLERNPKDAKAIIEKALLARKAREKAKKAKEAVRKIETKGSRLLNLPTKLVDCWSKNREECELAIVEGDSAAGGLVSARNSEFQAIFPLRGKIISSYKQTDAKIFANQEVVNLIKALGLEINAKTSKLIYDKSRLRYGKILLCMDADPDGESIKNLVLTLLWYLCPELILHGHVYCAIPPLFRITTRKNEYIFLRDAAALEEYKASHNGEKFQINRNKGLGEQDAQELDECLLNPETRNVVQVIVNDKDKSDNIIQMFMGKDTKDRKEYIALHSEEARI